LRRETSISILDIAFAYLEAALFHFNKKEYPSALHLAGAAEEILGKFAMKKVKSNSLKEKVAMMKAVHKNFGRPVEEKEIIERLNKFKNKSKHVDDPENDTLITGDWHRESEFMILRAIDNYEKVKGDYPFTESFNTFLNDAEIPNS
jgi:hypothetical protein